MKKIFLTIASIIIINGSFSQNLNPYEEFGYKAKYEYVRTKNDDGLYLSNKDTSAKTKTLLISFKTKQIFIINEHGSIIQTLNVPKNVLTRFISVDPLTKKYPELTPYQFASNRPIDGIDLDGLEFYKKSISYDVFSGKFNIGLGLKVEVASATKYANANIIGNEFQKQFVNALNGVYDSRRNIRYSAEAKVTYTTDINSNAQMKFIIDEATPIGRNSVTGQRLYFTGVPNNFNTQKNTFSSSAALIDETGECVIKVLSKEEIALTGVHESFHTAGIFHPFDEQNTANDVDLQRTLPYRDVNGLIHQNYLPSIGAKLDLIKTNVMNYPSTSVNGVPLGKQAGSPLNLNKISPDQAYQLVQAIGNDIGRQNVNKR